MEGEGKEEVLGGKKKWPKDLTKEVEKEGNRRKWVRQADREWSCSSRIGQTEALWNPPWCAAHTQPSRHTHKHIRCNQAHTSLSLPPTDTLHDLLASASQSQWQCSHAYLGSMATSFSNQSFFFGYVCFSPVCLNWINRLTLCMFLSEYV